ncbi:hypothetical protein AVEN_257548-1 [Araneus ventricosus]|uniref:Uncharacterized protein n=1 Tax=Araneus ventricosus TaxID=182803 RepID=A0A4Y2L2L3_ARAVE|nr:hypothetical protein AVEN_257548-1 [Araneus ventricosus]
MPVLGAEPSQEGRLWATSRVPVGGASIASDVRASSCREQQTTRWNAVRDVLTTLAFFSQGLKTTMGHHSQFNDELLQLYISLIVNIASSKCKLNPDNIVI